MRVALPNSLITLALIFSIIANSCREERRPDRKLLKNRDNWAVSGKIANADFAGGEVVALGLDGVRFRSRIDQNANFTIQLPGNSHYAVFFIDNSYQQNSDASPSIHELSPTSRHAAVLNFEESPDIGIRETLRLPKVLFNNQIFLGQVDIKNGYAFPTINPAQKLDFDHDSRNDFADQDDQNDGLPDYDQHKNAERIDICHFNDKGEGRSISVALSTLFDHLEEGDHLGYCTQANANQEDQLFVTQNAPSESMNGNNEQPSLFDKQIEMDEDDSSENAVYNKTRVMKMSSAPSDGDE